MDGPRNVIGAASMGSSAKAMVSRRTWIAETAVTLSAVMTTSVYAQPPKKPRLTADEDKVVRGVRDKGRKAGLGPLEVRWTDHFLGVGDAPADGYINPALGVCESFAREFLPHFRERGFTLEFPARRMTVVGLKDANSYRAYSGDPQNLAVGGHYEIDSNELVVFDFRPQQDGLAAGARRVNTFTLVHETAHMLCYNTGILPFGRDVPAAISEGLATYAELWAPPRDRTAFARVNHPRLRALDVAEGEWIPISRLLADDKVFDDPKTADMAYAESWLLVHHLLRQSELLPGVRKYLAGFPRPDEKLGREAYAERALGPLPDLDTEIQRYARRVRKRR